MGTLFPLLITMPRPLLSKWPEWNLGIDLGLLAVCMCPFPQALCLPHVPCNQIIRQSLSCPCVDRLILRCPSFSNNDTWYH